MAGYAVAGRVRRGTVHARVSGPELVVPVTREAPTAVAIESPAGDSPDAAVFPSLARLRLRFGELQASWSQLTWYLFNEEGWR